ncbi:MAG: hypothetical protein ACHP7D_09395 [Lysobacterales bacterium]
MNTSRVHTVHFAGATAEVTARVNALLDEQRNHLDARWQPADHKSADLLLIDAESVYGHMDWLKAHGSGRLVATCVSTPEAFESEYCLRKPILAPALVTLLNQIGARLDAKAGATVTPIRALAEKPAPAVTGSAPASAVTVPPPATPIAAAAPKAAPPVLHLLDLLDENPRMAGRLRLKADGMPTLFLDPRARTWHSASTLKAQSDWCARALAEGDVCMIGDGEFTHAVATMPGQPYARLQWLSHLILGDGNLDARLDANARYKLSRWPQSEREFPRHFRIATMMLKSAAPLEEIADLSGATLAEVANFVNAYHALGYIDHEQAEKAPEDTRRGGLFGRVRKTSAS